MKILISPAHSTLMKSYGSEILWSYELVLNLSSLNVDIYAIFNHTCLDKSDSLFDKVNIITFSNKRIIHSTFIETVIFMYNYFIASKSLIKKKEFDLIHHMLPFGYRRTFNLLPILGYTKGIPFVVGPLQSPLRFKGGMLNNLILKAIDPILFYLSKKTLEKADTLICVNEDSKNLYSKMVDKNKPIFVIPPGVNADKFNYVKRNEKNNLEILCISYLQNRKGINLIIKAFAEIIEKLPMVKLQIVGEGPEKDVLIELVDHLNLKEDVIFQGFIPNTEITKYYNNADIFVSMSYSESFGQTLLEAMATGLPVIATKTGAFKDIVIHGGTGFLIDNRISDTQKIDELKKYLVMLINDKELRYEMGQCARNIIETDYDWKIITKKYYDIYHNLVSSDRRLS